MTQEAVPEREPDAIDQVQSEMDADQGLSETSQPLTMEQVQGLLENQKQVYERQIAGITSKVDKGLNTMRSIAEATQRDSGVLRSDMSFDQIVATMDDEQRAAMLAWRDADRKVNAPSQPQPTAEPAPDDNWERVYRMAENMGLDRNDPNIRYDVLSNTNLTELQREQQFMASLSAAVQQKGQAAAPRSQPAARDDTSNPPVDRGGSGTGSPMNTDSQITDALIEGRITREQYIEQMAAIGKPVTLI